MSGTEPQIEHKCVFMVTSEDQWASTTGAVSNMRSMKRGKLFVTEDEVVCADSGTGLISLGGFLNKLFIGIPRLLQLYKPHGVSLSNADANAGTERVPLETIQGVRLRGEGKMNGWSIVVDSTQHPGEDGLFIRLGGTKRNIGKDEDKHREIAEKIEDMAVANGAEVETVEV